MRTIIVGCGRVGAGFAERLVAIGQDVTVVDIDSDAFSHLPSDFGGEAIRGDGTDEDTLRRIGADEADYLYALTEGDNRNILCAQLAAETLGVPHVVAKINDPVRAEAYTTLGLSTICRTTRLIDALGRYAGLPPEPGADGVHVALPHAHDRDGRNLAGPDSSAMVGPEGPLGAPASGPGRAPGEA
ncbi:MAG: potassium channel family protein [Candidatus Limnocylindrales bacterium]